jgi:alditol oxidase
VAHENATQAFDAIYGLREHVAPLLQISEVRTIAADRLWMSPCYERQSVAIHFTWKKNVHAVTAVLPMIEKALAPFDARPHWGKLFTISPTALKQLYPRLSDFQHLLKQYDPQGRFRNAFLDTFIF